MKKFLFPLLMISAMCACTTPEEDAQIRLFWLEQITQLLPQQMRPAPLPPQPLPAVPPEEMAPQEGTLPAQATAKSVVPAAKEADARRQVQFIEITMEENARRVNHLKSNAPFKERQAMQRAIENVKQANQQALRDIGTMFDGDTQAQAFVIVSKSEKILMRAANTSDNYQNYLNAQRKILQEQEAQLNQLMRANAYKLRRVRG